MTRVTLAQNRRHDFTCSLLQTASFSSLAGCDLVIMSRSKLGIFNMLLQALYYLYSVSSYLCAFLLETCLTSRRWSSRDNPLPVPQICTKSLAVLVHTIMHNLRLLISFYTVRNLVQVACPWQVQDHVFCDFRKPRMHVVQGIWHCIAIEVKRVSSILVARPCIIVRG